MHLFKCPLCGQEHRISDDLVGKKVVCKACEEVFPLSPDQIIVKLPTRPAKKVEEPWGPKLFKKVLRDPEAALDGSIPGAFSGESELARPQIR